MLCSAVLATVGDVCYEATLKRFFKEAIRSRGTRTDVDRQKIDKSDSVFQPLCFCFGVFLLDLFSPSRCGFVVPVHIAVCF